MMTDDELEHLATDLESDRVERKESLKGSAKTKIAEAICAFANDLPRYQQPGIVFVGLKDNGEPSGLEITDQLLLELGAFQRDGNILPMPSITVQKRLVRGADVAVVFVEPSADTPVRYDGRIWIRVGPRRSLATREDERILTEKRHAAHLLFEQSAATGAKLTDLDLHFFRDDYLPRAVAAEILAENHREIEEQLGSLHLLSPTGCPTYGALLLLGRQPRRFLHGAYVQYVRFDGTDKTDPILNQKELEGPMPRLLPLLDDLASINIKVATEIADHTYEKRTPDYPLQAIQQLLRNAVLHRSYEINAPVYWFWYRDYIEIHSPGGPFGRVNERNFRSGATDYRNPTLAQGLKVLGFVQRFGVGIEIAERACAENGNPPLEFDVHPWAVIVRIRQRAD